MAVWLTLHFPIAGIVTFVLMYCDWVLTVLQERERAAHYGAHYQSYPLNTIEGNPMLQPSVARQRIVDPKHLAVSIVVSAAVAVALALFPAVVRVPFLGYVFGLFLVAIATHVGNLIGYRASRRGLHGRLAMHLRTGYLVQMGRYGATAILLGVLAILATSAFIGGAAVAALTSALRQLLWMRRIPAIDEADAPPPAEYTGSDTLPTN